VGDSTDRDVGAPDAALPGRRRAQLVQLARERGQVTVAELVEVFDVSADTVRRDLDYLQRRGVLTRTHGGAVYPEERSAWRDEPFALRETEHADAKQLIGSAAAALVADGETVLLNGGTSTLAVARALGARRDLTIVTNNLRIPPELPRDAVRDVYLLGGQFRVVPLVTIGPVGFPASRSISADTAILGVGGISLRAGLSTTDLAEGQMIAEMIAASARIVIVADASKFGRDAFVHIAPLTDIDVLVTEAPPPPPLQEQLDAAEVQVVIADALKPEPSRG
jgi:DeoR/GlpR family transcriptional regulator of sugar metabolism